MKQKGIQEDDRINKPLALIYASLFVLSVTTIVLSIISSENKTHFELRIGKPSPPNLADTLADNAPEGVEFINEYALNEGGRFVEGLEFLNNTHMLMSSGLYGGSFLEILSINDDKIESAQ